MIGSPTKPVAPWAGFQYVSSFQPGESPSGALRRLGLTWETQTFPLKVSLPDPETGAIEDHELTQHVALMKPLAAGEAPELIDVVSTRYRSLGHNLIVEQLDRIAEEYTLDAVGTTPDGKTLVVVYDRGPETINREDHHRWILFSDHLVPSGPRAAGAYFATTVQRLQCLNQYPLQRLDKKTLSIRHTGNAQQHFMLHSDIITQLAILERQEKDLYTRMAYKLVTPSEVQEVLNQVYTEPPEPRNVVLVREAQERGVQFQQEHAQALLEVQQRAEWWKGACRTVQIHKERAQELINIFNDDVVNQGRGTYWAVWNGITQRANESRRRGWANSLLYGNTSKEMSTAMGVISSRLA